MNHLIKAGICIALATGLLAGCGGKGDSADPAASAAAGQADNLSEKLTVNLMTQSFGGSWPENAPVIQELNKKLNIDLKVQWVPSDSYQEKLSTLAASNDFPDVFLIDNTLFKKWRDKNLFMDIKPYIQKYPSLVSQVSEEAYKLLNPKDKIYGVPFYNIATRDGLVIRQDWLNKLNLKVPATIDEFYEVAKAFATKDPDGNGKDDTIGFTFTVNTKNGTVGDLDFLRGGFGIYNGYGEVNGKLVSQYEQAEQWKNLALFLRKAYAEGVLEKDFAIQKTTGETDKVTSNKQGITYRNPFNFEKKTDVLRKLAPEASFSLLPPPQGPKGQVAKTFDITSKVVINNKLDEKKKQRILKLLDYILSDEGTILTKNGVEGIHYKKTADGKYEKLPAFDTDQPQNLSTWFLRRFDPKIQIRLWDDQKKADQIAGEIAANDKYKQPNPANGITSETGAKVGTNLDIKFLGTFVQVIIGKEPLEAMDKAIADWKRGGGDQIVKETNEEYTKLK